MAKQNRDRGHRVRAFTCLGLFVVLAIGSGFFVNLTHQHGELYSRRACTICFNSLNMNVELMEDPLKLPEPIVSFASPEIVLETSSSYKVSSNTIRAPPEI